MKEKEAEIKMQKKIKLKRQTQQLKPKRKQTSSTNSQVMRKKKPRLMRTLIFQMQKKAEAIEASYEGSILLIQLKLQDKPQ
ncbi:hypothetical protein [Streptococcus bouchesdurhonensis]|uniref:hypothetical protein n=1 Tax=Streptococcus bouchesdurhonensis TaxID=2954240 RepID=UPI0021C3D703|nr:hypothetical protein [Streptococcus bouchesdurhonensis]